ncbi:peptide chain release factor N(5)-glutamine methyltransferase [Elioraea sp. Yellowstone]|jgi:release factor glutamine methyltransferase|uniref:peptide chain release factor N(5)-glutamine methyltransferase n=1 Tax=Elioraea sp. Yellowstone TaxID=2592070 RepID=UPI00114DC55A|nr:peptide chain release factor N(5)-glutamine methyltransferase [Elioraea sp. Yellowstone]TQF83152.1 peptide chain release factor N(5)-glutamine methyltransferase [Elioraea sp. Yellowstone]
MNPTIGGLLCEAGAILRAAGIEEPRREARLLLGHVLGRAPGLLTIEAAAPVGAADAGRFRALVARRAAREPAAHLTGRRGFWTLDLAVTPDVLVPRPESETLIEAALDALPDRSAVRRVLDLGTGSGALLLAALGEFPAAIGVGIDLSAAALAVARANAARCGLAERALFLCGDWSAALGGGFDLVLANPPYVATADIATLDPEVRDHDPRAALDGGPDGLAAYRAILADLPRLLDRSGLAVIELGAGQAADVAGLARTAGLATVELRQDLGGIPRAIALRHAEKTVGEPRSAD